MRYLRLYSQLFRTAPASAGLGQSSGAIRPEQRLISNPMSRRFYRWAAGAGALLLGSQSAYAEAGRSINLGRVLGLLGLFVVGIPVCMAAAVVLVLRLIDQGLGRRRDYRRPIRWALYFAFGAWWLGSGAVLTASGGQSGFIGAALFTATATVLGFYLAAGRPSAGR